MRKVLLFSRHWLVMMLLLAATTSSQGATISATSCQQSDVQAALNSARPGDVVQVPAGTCSWSGLSIEKAVHLSGRGVGQTNITLTGPNTITKQSTGVIRLSGFSFSKSGGGNASKGWVVNGTWTTSEPVVIENNSFTISGSGLFILNTVGGVIIAGNSFTGDWDDSFIQPKSYTSDSNTSWTTPSTMGANDTTGKLNHYVEGNTFFGGTNQGIDADDNTRVVYRYNRLTYSSFNSHGYDSSVAGVRHWEVYENTWLYPSFTGSPANNSVTNQGWAIWIRGGTGVIFNNNIPDIRSSWWGDPAEYKFSIRAAEDIRRQGSNSCADVAYPVPRQLGQSHDGSRSITDPIYVWNNVGPGAGIAGGWTWGNPCGLTWTDFYRAGRDYVSGTPKPGYTPYAYPHPLRSAAVSGSDSTAPTAPGGLTASAFSATEIRLNWMAATDNVGVTGYRVERCQGSGCTGFTQVGTTTTATSYADTGLAPASAYSYRVRAVDAAGNASGYSNTASIATLSGGPVDSISPSAPSGLSATVAAASQVNLAWQAASDNVGVAAYELQRCQGAGCSAWLDIAQVTGTSHVDSGLTPGTAYQYRVRARDAAGNVSAFSSVVSATTTSIQSSGVTPLPQGEAGIAAQYPLDMGIQANPNVILADDFEGYSGLSQLTSKWSAAYHTANLRLATEAANVFAGGTSLELQVPQQSAEVSNELVKTLSPNEDVVFVRAYTKFDAGHNVIGSNHNGIVVSSNYSTPGVPANGTNKFYVDVENSRESSSEASPGQTQLYVYHPEQRTEYGDHWYPDGRVRPFDAIPGNFGAAFVARPNFTPQLDRWYCYELMVRVNTPGQRDGRIAVWIDGNLIADYPNVRLRDTTSLRIDTVKLSFHIASNTIRRNIKWYDNVVIARSYIGPMARPVTTGPLPPTNLLTRVQ